MTLQIKESFQDLVDQAAILIDKTMLVKEFLNDDHDVIMITRPYGWFKTQNINMLRAFFERQLDENGQMMHEKEQTNNYELFTERYIAGVININMPCFRKINFKSYDCFNDTKYYKYFGITEDDALKLLKENDIPCENFDEVKAWYGGYKLSNELNEKVFHPLHFYLYLYSKTLKKFCASSHSIMIIKYLLQNPSTKKIWKNFKTNDFKESISHECKFINGDFLTIYDMLFNCSTFKLEPSSLNLILTYLFIDGYLTLDDYQGSDMFNKVKIANISMKKEMDSVLDFHLKKFF
jgi:hypothetical protein